MASPPASGKRKSCVVSPRLARKKIALPSGAQTHCVRPRLSARANTSADALLRRHRNQPEMALRAIRRRVGHGEKNLLAVRRKPSWPGAMMACRIVPSMRGMNSTMPASPMSWIRRLMMA
jgi:hypothetical protein